MCCRFHPEIIVADRDFLLGTYEGVMPMSTTIDARGLSCPQPVLLTLEAMKKISQGQLTVLVDTDTSKENVLRAAASQGWEAAGVQAQGGSYEINLRKG